MLRLGLPAVLAVLALAGCNSSERSAGEGAFAYDASQPLAYEDRGVVDPDYPLAVHDIAFRSGDDLVEGFLVVPPGDGPWPAAIYVHGAGSDRLSMLGPATWLAARGAVTLALTMPSGRLQRPDDPSNLGRLQAHRDLEVRDVLAVRRALDLLEEREDVDSARVGYVGWSAGARTGALLSGLESRLSGIVLVAPGSAPVEEFVAAAADEDKAAVEKLLTPVDPLAHIHRADPERLLIQEGERDVVIPRTAIDALIAAAPEGTDVRWYDADHALGPRAYREHLDWLQDKLGIEGPPVPGAQTEPPVS
jgi:dienelactone hydrolase